ncbi:MAG: AIR carboxylase family protein [Candidatus Bipolaricaulia bacterium]
MMKIVIIMGSQSDKPWAEKIKQELDRWQLPAVLHVSSAHKIPEQTLTLVQKYNLEQHIIYVTIAGRSNALSGVVSANAIHPVIACPPFKDQGDYLVNIHSSLQMPSDTPAMTILDPKNVAAACARMLGLVDFSLQQSILQHIQKIKKDFK